MGCLSWLASGVLIDAAALLWRHRRRFEFSVALCLPIRLEGVEALACWYGGGLTYYFSPRPRHSGRRRRGPLGFCFVVCRLAPWQKWRMVLHTLLLPVLSGLGAWCW